MAVRWRLLDTGFFLQDKIEAAKRLTEHVTLKGTHGVCSYPGAALAVKQRIRLGYTH